MDSETLLLLGFPRVLEIIQKFAQSPLGKAEVAKSYPSTDRQEIEQKLLLLDECLRYTSQQQIAFHQLQDPSSALTNLALEGQVLEPREFLILADLLKTAKQLKNQFSKHRWPHLAQKLQSTPDLGLSLQKIEQSIELSGEIRDRADPELGPARRQQAQSRQRVQGHLTRYFTGPKSKFLIQEPFVTIRNGRYVIPVKVEHQRDLPGVVHGASSSGATVFVEPFPAVELNNQCVYYADLEHSIISRVLRNLTEHLRPSVELFRHIAQRVAELDALFAAASFAVRYRCVIPRLNETRFLELHDARHPLLIESLGEDRVVPISVKLSSERNALVISGPNTGGKTVALKTVGLFSLLAQAGLPVPAAGAELPLFHQVLADIGDHQSISEQLSTFSAHVLALKKMTEVLETPGLILLDEIGRGTDPVHGSSLGIAVIDFFRHGETLVIATTHHQAIKSFAIATSGVESASVELDEETLRPTYQLKLGLAGASSGLEIAAQLGIPREIVHQARNLLPQGDIQAERYLAQLRRELKALQNQQGELRFQMERLKEQELEWRAEFQRKEREREEANQNMLKQWEEDFRRESERFLARLEKQVETERLKREIKRKEALLKEVFRRKVTSQDAPEGAIKKTVKILHRPEKTEDKKGAGDLPRNVTLHMVEEELEAELDLIGCTVVEALMKTDKFLDRAFISQLLEVKIIHGFGTGRLRAALSEFLKDHPQVSKHRVEGGATIVELKD